MTTSEYGLTVLQVHYTGCEVIELDLNDFYKDRSFILNLYIQINEYVQTLPLVTQKEIYDIFFKVYSNEDKRNYSNHECVVRLEQEIAEVSRLLNYRNFKTWIATKESQMLIPETVKGSYTHDPDMNTTEEKTYVRHEYRDLIGLIIFMRAISPLYIEFHNYIKLVTSHYYYKIFMLFIRSDIYESPEIAKLKRYIEVNQMSLVGNSNEHLVITAGLSDDDILDSLVSEIIFNKLLTIDFFSKTCNIISFIFQTIKYKGNFVTSDSTVIRSKTTSSDQSKDDISYFEDYRKTSNIPVGTVVEIQHALSDVASLASLMGYQNFDVAQYNKELDYVKVLMNKPIDKVQIYLLGWFLNKVINPRALYYIELRKLVELMLFAKVVLSQNGHLFIGSLLGSYRSSEGGYVQVIIRNNLNKSLIKKLESYYGFSMEADKQSIIEKTITEIAKEIANSLWVPISPTTHPLLVADNVQYLEIPGNVNDIICSYVAHINDVQAQ